MPNATTLRIYFGVRPDQSIAEALEGLPRYCSESFKEHSEGSWNGEFQVSCPEAPELAAGDLVDDLAPYFPQLLRLKTFYDAVFEMQIAVGPPAPDIFVLESNIVALLASLGTEIQINSNNHREKLDNA